MSGSSVALKEFNIVRGQNESKATIIAIGGGKGGVGKSFVSSSLSIFLGHLGFETLLVDLDLGAGNVHTCLGEGLPGIGINEFLTDPSLPFKAVVAPTKLPHLSTVTGATEAYDIANITEEQKTRLLSAIFNYKADFIVLDLSAGTHSATLDFFLMAQHKIIVLTPEPSSLENAYRFMKSAYYRRLRRYEDQLHLETQLDSIMKDKERWGIRSPADLLKIVTDQNPQSGVKLQNIMSSLEFDIILNQCRSLRDNELGPQIKSVCHKYFGVNCHLLGHIEYDNAVWQSLRKRRPLVLEYPQSRLYAQLLSVARRLAASKIKKAAG